MTIPGCYPFPRYLSTCQIRTPDFTPNPLISAKRTPLPALAAPTMLLRRAARYNLPYARKCLMIKTTLDRRLQAAPCGFCESWSCRKKEAPTDIQHQQAGCQGVALIAAPARNLTVASQVHPHAPRYPRPVSEQKSVIRGAAACRCCLWGEDTAIKRRLTGQQRRTVDEQAPFSRCCAR